MIPQTIAQTWRSAELEADAERLAGSWRKHNPAMSYRLFDDAAAAAMVADVAPEHFDAYQRFPFAVMRADFFRYAVIYRDGGVYADIDMECLRPIGVLLSGHEAVFSVEAQITTRRQAELGYAKPFQIANCIFAARPRHPFLKAAMDRAAELAAGRSSIAREDIEDITGPRMLTRLFYEALREDIQVTHQIVLMAPKHYPDVWPLNRNVHARHHFFGSWKQEAAKTLRRRWTERDIWPNPFPDSAFDRNLSGPAMTSARAA